MIGGSSPTGLADKDLTVIQKSIIPLIKRVERKRRRTNQKTQPSKTNKQKNNFMKVPSAQSTAPAIRKYVHSAVVG